MDKERHTQQDAVIIDTTVKKETDLDKLALLHDYDNVAENDDKM